MFDFLQAQFSTVIFDSKSARIARTPFKEPRPGKIYRGLSQCERTYGMAAVVSANAGAGLATGEHFLESEKMGTETVSWQEKNYCVNFDVANIVIGMDMKFDKLTDNDSNWK